LPFGTGSRRLYLPWPDAVPPEPGPEQVVGDHHEYFEIIVAGIFVNNILLAQFLGNCPFPGHLQKDGNRHRHGHGRRFRSGIGRRDHLDDLLLAAGALRKLTFLADHRLYSGDRFAGAVRGDVSEKEHPGPVCRTGNFSAADHDQLRGLSVPACSISIKELDFLPALVTSFAYAAGFGLALILFAGVRERILLAGCPKPLRDTSIALVTAGIISLSFYAFRGMV
jgi:Na+-translocating ferredoxin:NAD+ oxidoreductase subunit A